MENEVKQPEVKPNRIYIFTVQRGPIHYEVSEDVQTILASSEQDAVMVVRKSYPQNEKISIKKRSEFSTDRLLNQLGVISTVTSTVPVISPVPLISPREIKEQEFIQNLMYITDRFVSNKRDQATLKRIINRVLEKHEPNKKTLVPKESSA